MEVIKFFKSVHDVAVISQVVAEVIKVFKSFHVFKRL